MPVPQRTGDADRMVRQPRLDLPGIPQPIVLRDDPLLSRHTVQRALGDEASRVMLAETISDDDLAAIRL